MNTRKYYNRSSLARFANLRVQYGRKGSFPIDQTPSQPFNIDVSTGRPMTEIERLVKIQNSVNQQAFFASLSEFRSNFLPDDVTDEDALTFIKSRYCQTKGQLLDYKEGLAKYQLDQQAKLDKAAALKKQQEENEKWLADLREEVKQGKLNFKKEA